MLKQRVQQLAKQQTDVLNSIEVIKDADMIHLNGGNGEDDKDVCGELTDCGWNSQECPKLKTCSWN